MTARWIPPAKTEASATQSWGGRQLVPPSGAPSSRWSAPTPVVVVMAAQSSGAGRRVRARRRDRVVPAGAAHPELTHHVVVLVNEVVAVDHVPARVRAELHDDPDPLVLAEVDDVLRAELLRLGSRRTPFLSISRSRIRKSTRWMCNGWCQPPESFLELPDLHPVERRVGQGPGIGGGLDVRPGLAVDGPLPVLADEGHRPGRGGARGRQGHDGAVRVEHTGDRVVRRCCWPCPRRRTPSPCRCWCS